MALLKDNPSVDNLKDVTRYMNKLDHRLSVPKFIRFETENLSPVISPRRAANKSPTSPNGMSQQDRERIRRSKYRSGSMMMPLSEEQRNNVLNNIAKSNYATNA